jgi:hypothetical protein
LKFEKTLADSNNLITKLLIKNKLKTREISLRDTILPGASTGVFSKEKNIIYYTKEKLIVKENGEFLTYRLVINNINVGI